MTDKNQRKRLEIYSNILIATNELLFKSLANNLKTKFDAHYKLNLDDRNFISKFPSCFSALLTHEIALCILMVKVSGRFDAFSFRESWAEVII